MKKKLNIKTILVIVATIIILGISLFPYFYMIIQSLAPWDQTDKVFIPSGITLKSYEYLLGGSGGASAGMWVKALLNSFIVSAPTAIVSVLVGIALTLPISSAAICMMLGLSGLAGGAATVGCCCQMVGFAVMSYKENGIGGLFAQGLGTSMLQMSNIIKNWKIWIPPTLASAILGPLSTVVFKMQNIPIGSGMGTCGLVGQFGTVTAMTEAGNGGAMMWVGILLLNFILPAIVTLIIAEFMRKKDLIKPGDLKLDI